MHIKQVIMEGFKSYKDRTVVEPFSPRINAVVGPNGSGKSNFFHAIRFVFSDIFSQQRMEEKQRLLHEGAGHAVQSAYVEIIIDNSDRRAPIDKDEFTIRRTVNLKKDDYSIDRKHTTKSELVQLLETAGFSRANPYYVVQQGKIQAMMKMTDAQRLDLLKEMGGTKVYEERRKESLRVLGEAEGRRAQIEEMVKQLDDRLSELKAEREELEAWHTADKQRRGLEFAIYNKELNDTSQRLTQVDAEEREVSERAGRAAEDQQEQHMALKQHEAEVRRLEASQAATAKQRGEVAEDRAAALQQKASAELDVAEVEQRLQAGEASKARGEQELQQLALELTAKQQQLTALNEELQRQREAEGALSKQVTDAQRQLQALYQKQGHSQSFRSAAERDAWIQDEVDTLRAAAAKKQEVAADLAQRNAAQGGDLMDLSSRLGDMEAAVRQREASIKDSTRQHAELKRRRDELNDQRKELFRQQDDVQQNLARVTADSRQAQQQLEGRMARDTARALSAVNRIAREHSIPGVYGPLIELFECPATQYAAVEVTAGNALFHVVVDSDATATRVLKLLNAQRTGRVTFMPLNKLQPERPEYPTAGDVWPVTKLLTADSKFEAAIQQVFGKTMLCRSAEAAHRVANEHRLNGVTMDGTRVDKKMSYRGGFIDMGRLKLAAMKQVRDAVRQRAQLQADAEKIAEQLEELNSAIDAAQTDLQKLDGRQAHARAGLDAQRAELARLRGECAVQQRQLEAREERQKELEAAIEALQRQIADHTAELGAELHANLGAEDQRQLARLQPDLERMQGELIDLSSSVKGAKDRQEQAQEHVAALQAQQAKLRGQTEAGALDADREALGDLQRRAERLAQEVAGLAEQEQGLEAAAEAAAAQAAARQEEAEALREALGAEAQAAQDKDKRLEQLEAKRATLQARRKDLEDKIHDLGTLPTEAFGKYEGRELKDLHRLLNQANAALKKFGHVNKKALDQFMSFTEQREDLMRRAAENRRGHDKIRQLIETLDMRKDEAIQRTFRQVAKYFREIFGELAPGHRGDLVMQRRSAPAALQDGSDSEAEEGDGRANGGAAAAADAVPQYTGVKVKHSFGSGEKQLSGGQKTLVALALIFAIQRCDPAPFYLFDEIDAALDPQYRTTVARMLAQQAGVGDAPAQFIMTTFHPQILHEADHVYGVQHRASVSSVTLVNKEDALEFVQDAQAR